MSKSVLTISVFMMSATSLVGLSVYGNSEGRVAPAPDKHQLAATAQVQTSKKDSWLDALYQSFLTKLAQMQNLDEDNAALRKKVAMLEAQNAELQEAQAVGCEEQPRADVIKAEAKQEGGVESARTIASLATPDPTLLARPPKAVFESAMQSFQNNDFESAAKALVFLTDNSENDAYLTAQTYYFAGVSLYQIGNYKQAIEKFEHAAKLATATDAANNVSYAPRSLLGISLCQARLGNKAAEAKTVRELIQKYPMSREARRLNRHG